TITDPRGKTTPWPRLRRRPHERHEGTLLRHAVQHTGRRPLGTVTATCAFVALQLDSQPRPSHHPSASFRAGDGGSELSGRGLPWGDRATKNVCISRAVASMS